MHTTVDFEIISNFLSVQDQYINSGDRQKRKLWNSFEEFLGCETHLTISNFNISEINNGEGLSPTVAITQFTENRNNFSIKFQESIFKQHKNIIKDDCPFAFYCLNEDNEDERRKYLKKNGFLIGFEDNYLERWNQLKLLEKKSDIPIRKNMKPLELFSSWSSLKQYFTPFTDAVIWDNYIFSDQTLIPSNFEKILLELDKATPIKYNLTIITYENDGKYKIDGADIYEKIKETKQRLNLKCNVELIVLNQNKKEHDRGIITNYLYVQSGDSFNYFNSKDDITTKGTNITFGTMADPDKRLIALAALKDLSEKKIYMKSKFQDTHTFGNCKNRLLIPNNIDEALKPYHHEHQ